ncbi:MAG: polyhydroxyalkanoate biosynthesis repressor PhaR [Euryarchaeota archaeon]|nr:polyhydroxyalkanoate biosynthesis repressor PhaR [Euryarchaeota archaeon]|tara:strand:- start:1049 stop:2077 length:1029 start_codon:yes stop_codon:yes gene_type:complete
MIKFSDIIVSDDNEPFIIAEAGINHDGDFKKALELIDVAVVSGASAIKFQTHITDKEMIPTDMKPGNISEESLWDIIDRCVLNTEQEKELFEYSKEKGILFFSTPFSREGADRLNELGVELFKIGSGECNNIPLLDHVAKFNKPMILSTGMNDIESIKTSVETILNHGTPLAVLHCTSIYPAPPETMRLGAITHLKETFPDLEIGLSDHSLGISVSLGAVAIGANIIEKHFTKSRKWPGPDNPFSIEPNELEQLVQSSKEIWKSRGGRKDILPDEQPVIDFAYASVVTIKDIKKGDIFTLDNLWVKRPGTGEILAPEFYSILNKEALVDIPSETQLTKEMYK